MFDGELDISSLNNTDALSINLSARSQRSQRLDYMFSMMVVMRRQSQKIVTVYKIVTKEKD